MNIDINQYDLSELFQFDLLKNILVNITTEQKKLRDEINKLKLAKKSDNDNINDDQNRNIDNIYGLEYELNKDNDELNKIINDEKNKNIKGNDTNDNKLNINEINKDININKENKIENIQKEKESNKNNIKGKMPIKSSDKLNKASQNSILFFIKETKNLDEKINNLENKLTKDFESQIKKIETESKENIKSLLEENKSTYNKLDEQLNALMKNNEEQNKKIESCILKYDSIDIYNVLKNTSNNKLDSINSMVTALEEKVFKKLDYIEDKHNEDFERFTKLLESNENNSMKLEKLQKNIVDIKYNDLTEIREYLKKNLKENEKKIIDLLNSLNKKERDLSSKMDNIEKNILVILEEKQSALNKNKETMDEFQDNLIDIQNKFEEFCQNQNDINKKISNDIQEKINLFKNKLNSVETKIKQIDYTNEIKQFDKDMKEINNTLKEKITYDNLNDLYKLQSNDAEDINNIQRNILTIQENIKKCVLNYETMGPKVDAFIEYLISKKNKKKPKKEVIDLTQLITKETFDEILKNLTRRIDSIFIEIDSYKRNLDDIKSEQNQYERKDVIIKMEEQIHSEIDENRNKIQKNRNELNKQLRGIEVDIKSIWNELKKKESADSWILAKHPMKCFNCASCNNDIKIEPQKEEYIPWNRILPSTRSYRQGKGYSHVLEKMSNDFINNNDEKNESKEKVTLNQDKDIKNSSTNNINSSTQLEETKINNSNDTNINIIENFGIIERSSSQPKLPLKKRRNQKGIINEKMQLPQVVDMARKKAIFDTFKNISSCSDKDRITINEYLIKNVLSINSPKVVKIKKKNTGKNLSFNHSLKINNP